MDLTPTQFESLITNLFSAMGVETRQTQASRDGGVDCVADDPRPIFGGKVVIQAKRYKNTVGVSAVRDQYGTMQNEGALKGILVTTSDTAAPAISSQPTSRLNSLTDLGFYTFSPNTQASKPASSLLTTGAILTCGWTNLRRLKYRAYNAWRTPTARR